MDSRSIRKITETDFPKFIIVEYEKVSSVDYYIDLLVYLITAFLLRGKEMEVVKSLMESDITVDLASILVSIRNSFYSVGILSR